MFRLRVAVETPQHAGLADLLDYSSEFPVPVGGLVRVPLGRRQVLGVNWECGPEGAAQSLATIEPALSLRPIVQHLSSMPPLPGVWLDLARFTARYYQRGWGEVALAALPPELRKINETGLGKRLARMEKARLKAVAAGRELPSVVKPPLTPQQASAWHELSRAMNSQLPACHLVHGATGSGKTEVYLRTAEQALEQGRQALILVPEINLTPQLEARFAARFPGRCLVTLHSGLTPVQRLENWLRAHLGWADLVLGTRSAVFCPMPRLGLVVVDEEHDPSYKQQDSARYSARDLAVYLGRLARVPVLLGSATPSLESWHHAQSGRYCLLSMDERVGGGALPELRILDVGRKPGQTQPSPALAQPLVDAIESRIARGEQSLLFLNRRGFAPVLTCMACGWKSGCPHCSAWRVFHKPDRSLRCHHCGHSERVPMACPDCGNPDIEALGRGTQRLEEQVAELLPGARIARIDADSTRQQGSLVQQMAAMHAGEVDVLVGTQMVTKGHDFRRVTLVAAINPDGALFAPDFRGPERLFATLMQAAGRAGRDAHMAERSEMWVQTTQPDHPLYAALKKHDYVHFAQAQLVEREMAGLPPFSHLALLRSDARDGAAAENFLREARQQGLACAAGLAGGDEVNFYAPVPLAVARVAGLERRQMLLESRSRKALHQVLQAWVPLLHGLRRSHKGLTRWAIDVDPMGI